MFNKVSFISFFSFCLFYLPFVVEAKPDLSIKTGVTVADTGAPGYKFTRLQFTKQATKPNTPTAYRVNLAIPDTPPPAEGFPLLIMLDGNAALMETSKEILTQLSHSVAPPVLAFLSHDNDLRIDGNARAWDYTPLVDDSALSGREIRAGREYGGADQYLSFITHEVIPSISKTTRVNTQKTGLWGHSFGGLFVLHTLFTQPNSFAFYAPVDPSLWWGNGYILLEEQTMLAKGSANMEGKSLLVLTGSGNNSKRSARTNREAKTLEKVYKAREAVPAEETRKMVERLKIAGVRAELTTLQGLSHGETLGASLPVVLNQFNTIMN